MWAHGSILQAIRRKRKREGVAAVEFALVGPILILLLIGIVVYGGWFLMAQSVQALASEGAPRPATLLSVLGLVNITGKADVEAADTGFKPLRFNAADIEAQRVKTMASRSFASGLVSSLLARLELTVIGLDLGGLTRALGQLLTPLGPVLDGVLNPVLDVLGLKLGEADVVVHGLSCPTQGRSTVKLVG